MKVVALDGGISTFKALTSRGAIMPKGYLMGIDAIASGHPTIHPALNLVGVISLSAKRLTNSFDHLIFCTFTLTLVSAACNRSRRTAARFSHSPSF
jgi:hypothetical protein